MTETLYHGTTLTEWTPHVSAHLTENLDMARAYAGEGGTVWTVTLGRAGLAMADLDAEELWWDDDATDDQFRALAVEEGWDGTEDVFRFDDHGPDNMETGDGLAADDAGRRGRRHGDRPGLTTTHFTGGGGTLPPPLHPHQGRTTMTDTTTTTYIVLVPEGPCRDAWIGDDAVEALAAATGEDADDLVEELHAHPSGVQTIAARLPAGWTFVPPADPAEEAALMEAHGVEPPSPSPGGPDRPGPGSVTMGAAKTRAACGVRRPALRPPGRRPPRRPGEGVQGLRPAAHRGAVPDEHRPGGPPADGGGPGGAGPADVEARPGPVPAVHAPDGGGGVGGRAGAGPLRPRRGADAGGGEGRRRVRPGDAGPPPPPGLPRRLRAVLVGGRAHGGVGVTACPWTPADLPCRAGEAVSFDVGLHRPGRLLATVEALADGGWRLDPPPMLGGVSHYFRRAEDVIGKLRRLGRLAGGRPVPRPPVHRGRLRPMSRGRA